MPLTLHIPGLLHSAALADKTVAPALCRLLDTARARLHPDGAIAALAPRYAVARQQDWPLAPLRLASYGVQPGSTYWLRATPVTLEATQNDVHIAREVDDLAAAESDALATALATHFAQDGIAFIAPRTNDWYAGVERTPNIATAVLRTVIGQPLRARLPHGADAPLWRRWQQEIEMLLHGHPVNRQREQDGRTLVNGVWFQYGGILPAEDVAPDMATWSDDTDLMALALHIGRAAHPPQAALPRIGQEHETCVVSVPRDMTLARMDEAYAAPALAALHSRRTSEVDVIGDAVGAPAVQWSCQRASWLDRLTRRRPAALRETVARALDNA